MRILLIADTESKYLWDFYKEEVFESVDFIISAGDLKSGYLTFLNTVARKRLLYVVGNHDQRYLNDPPLGCDSLDDTILVQNGLRILGLGGSYRYKTGPYQYSEQEMRKRIKKLQVLIDQFNGFDILVTHAPASGYGDAEDLCHTGFQVFNELIETYHPSYFFHGHQHLNYSHKSERIHQVGITKYINGYNYYFVDYVSNNYIHPQKKLFARILNTIKFYFKYKGEAEWLEYKKLNRYNTMN
jgi:uncharacterized protein